MKNEVIKGLGVHHIALNVSNFEASLAFYTEVFGMKQLAAWGGEGSRAVMLDIGDGAILEMFECPRAAEHSEMSGEYVHLALKADDIDAAFARAIAGGAKEKSAPADVDIPATPAIPVRVAFVYGLDGEVIEFFRYRD